MFRLASTICPDPTSRPGFNGVVGKCIHHDGIYGVRQDMSEAEVVQLRGVLEQPAHALPTVHSEMTDAEIAEFLVTYRAIPADERPVWEPQIYSQANRLQNRDERVAVWLRHGELLRDQIGKGRVRIFDSDRIPMDALRAATPTFLVRDDVRAHLARMDLRLEEVMEDRFDDEPESEDAPTTEAADDQPQSEKAPASLAANDEAQREPGPSRSRRRWTPAMNEEFDLIARNHSDEVVAERFAMTIEYVRKHKRRLDEKRILAAKKEEEDRVSAHDWMAKTVTHD
ncbi:hypothetical protein D9M72_323900 [compost metagenome]